MTFFKKIFVSKEIKALDGVLDELNYTYDTPAFHFVREKITDILTKYPDDFQPHFKEGMSPRQMIFTSIANLYGDLVESGKYHLHRGVLNPSGLGVGLLELFDIAVDELVKLGVVEEENANIQKQGIRDNIKNVG